MLVLLPLLLEGELLSLPQEPCSDNGSSILCKSFQSYNKQPFSYFNSLFYQSQLLYMLSNPNKFNDKDNVYNVLYNLTMYCRIDQ